MSYLGNALINHVLRGVVYPPPATIYIALITDSGEVIGGAYTRVNVTGNFSPPSPDDVSYNQVRIDFPVPTTSWGQVVSAAFYDASSGGNLLFVAPLATPMNIPAQAPVYWEPGKLGVQLTVEGS